MALFNFIQPSLFLFQVKSSVKLYLDKLGSFEPLTWCIYCVLNCVNSRYWLENILISNLTVFQFMGQIQEIFRIHLFLLSVLQLLVKNVNKHRAELCWPLFTVYMTPWLRDEFNIVFNICVIWSIHSSNLY